VDIRRFVVLAGTGRATCGRTVTCAGLAAAAALLAAGCGASNKEPPAPSRAGSGQVVPVQVGVAARTNLAVTKTYSGTLEGEDQANIVAKVPERITAIRASVGSATTANQVLITLDKSGASSQYFQAEAAYRNAGKTLERMKSLYEEGAVSQQTLDGAQTGFDVARANFDGARSTVELTTPIAGVVTAVSASVGDLATPGAPLMTIARIGRMKIIFNMTEADMVHLAAGQPVSVYSEARPDQQVEGRVIQLSRSADVGSRTFEVKALFPNTRDGWFKPGMFCKVRVLVAARDSALVVPTAAVQSDGASSRVFVIRNGRAYQRPVQQGAATDRDTEILEGIAPDDTVATVGVNNLRDSIAVQVTGL
jgi:RND family efflux transporter MFP subunit